MFDALFGSFLIPLLIGMGFLAFLAGIIMWAKRYVKVPPDQVAIITGRKRKMPDGRTVGYRQVRGGATFVMPLIEQVQYLPLQLLTIPIPVQNAYNRDGVPVTIDAVANVKIKGEDAAIANAVERFLGQPESIRITVTETLEGHLRSIVGQMSVEELNSDRKTFAQTLTGESLVDLERMGIGIDSVVIKRIADGHGYLDALGIKRTAEVKRDAEIGRAQAEAEAKKKTTDATREAAQIAAENERQIAEAEKSLNVQRAVYMAEVERQRAIADQAGPLAHAEAEKAVRVAQQEAKAAETVAAAEVQEREAVRREKELDATTITEANATKERVIIEAEAGRQSMIIQADAEATARLRRAEAEQQAARNEAEAVATKIRQKGQAEADAVKAGRLADAEGLKANMIAEAEGVRAKLLAEAEGKRELAEALKQLNEAGQLLFLLEKSPDFVRSVGEAGGEIARGIFQSLAAPLGSIDHLSVYDSGGGTNGHGAMERLASTVPGMFFNFLQQCRANNIELGSLVENFVGLLNQKLVSSQNNATTEHERVI